MFGSASLSSSVAGWRFLLSVARSTRNGCWNSSDLVDTSSVGGDSLIVFARSEALREIASNVVA